MAVNEGVRRLSLLVGIICLGLWLIWGIWLLSQAWSDHQRWVDHSFLHFIETVTGSIVFLVVGAGLVFLLPLGAIRIVARIVAWVWSGFKGQ